MSMTIVVAWLEEGQVFNGKPYAADLGARPGMRVQVQAKAAVWINDGSVEDLEKARAFVTKQEPKTGRVYVYDASIANPQKQAREDVLCGRAGR